MHFNYHHSLQPNNITCMIALLIGLYFTSVVFHLEKINWNSAHVKNCKSSCFIKLIYNLLFYWLHCKNPTYSILFSNGSQDEKRIKLKKKMLPLINTNFENTSIYRKTRLKNLNVKMYTSFWWILSNILYLQLIFCTDSTNTTWAFSFRL